MKISINWLKEYVKTDSNPAEISEILTKNPNKEKKSETTKEKK